MVNVLSECEPFEKASSASSTTSCRQMKAKVLNCTKLFHVTITVRSGDSDSTADRVIFQVFWLEQMRMVTMGVKGLKIVNTDIRIELMYFCTSRREKGIAAPIKLYSRTINVSIYQGIHWMHHMK